MNREFNLIDEPWIRVINSEFETEDVSLRTVFERAHLYRALAGELEAQNVAVLRMLLALLYSVFIRYDTEGSEDEITEADEAVDRWRELWNLKKFPIVAINRYLDAYYDRFWLIDDKRPFYQIQEASVGTFNSAAKLNGVIAESNNKVRMFSERAGSEKDILTYAEAARWLLYINSFDDTASKPKGKNLPSPGAGWLGKLGLILAQGDNFHKTLLLNLVFLQDGMRLWDSVEASDGKCACWELDLPRKQERTEIRMPENLPALYTLQSRRIKLKEENGAVSGYCLLGGDFFSRENAFNEQMTMWRMKQEKERTFFIPRRHDPSRQIWREFSTITEMTEEMHRPGIVSWLHFLHKANILADKDRIDLQIVSVQYGDKDFFVTDAYSDNLSFHSQLLDEIGEVWRVWVKNEIALCDKCAYSVKGLAEDLKKATGDSGDVSGSNYQEQFYTQIDPIFREWLVRLNPRVHEENYVLELRKSVKKTALVLGRKMVEETGQTAFRGRYVQEGKGNSILKKHYSSPEAYNRFLYNINAIYGGS